MFKKHYEILLEWNKKINLVSRGLINQAPTKNNPILEKHFLDSMIFLPEIEGLITKGVARYAPTRILDIGSGGGFPAIPLAILKPEWDWTLCESIKKKANFLEYLIKNLEIQNVSVMCNRVETCHGMSLHRSNYDLITARAAGKLNELIKYSMPLLKNGGSLIAYKAKDIESEIKNAEKLIQKNNLKLKIFSKEVGDVVRKLVVLSTSGTL